MAISDPIYNVTPPSPQDGQTVRLQVDADGNLKVVDAGTDVGATGTVSDGAETDENQDATVISLLKGILVVLKQIEVNTTPEP